MGFAATEMRFPETAVSVAIAPMDIGTARMGISVTEVSFVEAPTAVAVTAMRIEEVEKGIALPQKVAAQAHPMISDMHFEGMRVAWR
jgi:hypothetical protein